jgi:large subunit ribosomal protein L31e
MEKNVGATEETEEAEETEETEETEEIEEAEKEEVLAEEAEEAEAPEVTEETLAEEEAEEEAIPEVKEKKEVEKEEEIVEEKFYTIPLRRAWISPRQKRAPKAMGIVKSFVRKHMKLRTEVEVEGEEEAERLVVSNEVNEKIWRRGTEKPPRKIKVRAAKDKEGVVTIYLAEGD